MSRSMWLIVGIVAIVVVIGIIAFSGGETEVEVDTETGDSASGGSENAVSDEEEVLPVEPDGGIGDGAGPPSAAWMEFELTDVSTGDSFKISDFRGKPVLLESFAVWCPKCTSQQKNIRELHEEPGFSEDELVSIALNTDPSEDEDKIRNHVNSNGFTWRYAVSPIEMTESLIEEFGNGIVSAPSVPIILVCEDGSFRKLGGFGSRNVDELKAEIASGCGG